MLGEHLGDDEDRTGLHRNQQRELAPPFSGGLGERLHRIDRPGCGALLVDPERRRGGEGGERPIAMAERRRQLAEQLGEHRRVGDRLTRCALLEMGAESLRRGLKRRQLGDLGQHLVELVEAMKVVGVDEHGALLSIARDHGHLARLRVRDPDLVAADDLGGERHGSKGSTLGRQNQSRTRSAWIQGNGLRERTSTGSTRASTRAQSTRRSTWDQLTRALLTGDAARRNLLNRLAVYSPQSELHWHWRDASPSGVPSS